MGRWRYNDRMPTPFTHLEIAQRLLADEAVPVAYRDLLRAECGAFLLGNVAADARVGNGAPRSATHFYEYGQPIEAHPWRVMTGRNPGLLRPQDDAHRAFVAGYVAHLSVDEAWSLHMVGPHFYGRDWADGAFRYYMLHIILIYMDERDLLRLDDWHAPRLARALPRNWLPFISDADLKAWQRLIHDQISPDGASRTLEIFGGRIGVEPGEIRTFLDSPQQMQAGLWQHIPPALLQQTEARFYQHAREQMTVYLELADG